MSRRRFRDLKIGTRQAIGFGLILSILAAGTTFTVWRMSDLRERIEDISDIWLHRAVAVSDFNQNVSVLRTKQLQHAFAGRPEDREPFVPEMLSLIDEINADADTYLGLVSLARERGLEAGAVDSLIAAIGDQWDDYLDHSLEYLELIDAGQSERAIELLSGPANEVFDGLSLTLEKLVGLDAALAEQAAVLASQTYVSTRNRAILVLLVSIGLTIGIGLALNRWITGPLNELVQASRAIGEGRFDRVPVAHSGDEIGALTRTFRWMAKSLGTQQERLKRANSEL
jgi:HAMP domain-containing protein